MARGAPSPPPPPIRNEDCFILFELINRIPNQSEGRRIVFMSSSFSSFNPVTPQAPASLNTQVILGILVVWVGGLLPYSWDPQQPVCDTSIVEISLLKAPRCLFTYVKIGAVILGDTSLVHLRGSRLYVFWYRLEFCWNSPWFVHISVDWTLLTKRQGVIPLPNPQPHNPNENEAPCILGL